MILLIGGGILFIVFGVGMLVMPNSTPTLDRFDSQLRGGKPREGGAYGTGRVVRGLALIVAGAVMLLIPFLIFGQLD